jgi:hypothetical protein
MRKDFFLAVARVEAPQKMVRQGNDVLLPLPQGGHPQGKETLDRGTHSVVH